MHIRVKSFFLCALFTAGAALSASAAHAEYVQAHIQHADYGTVRIVVPVSSPDPKVWAFKLHNISNSLNAAAAWHGTLQAEVVLYGPGVKLLSNPTPELQAVVDELRGAGVKFAVCNNTLKGMDLDWHTLDGVKEQDIVPAGFLEVGWLANHGWAVDAMN